MLNAIMDLFTHNSCDWENWSKLMVKFSKNCFWVKWKTVLGTALLLTSLEIWIFFLTFLGPHSASTHRRNQVYIFSAQQSNDSLGHIWNFHFAIKLILLKIVYWFQNLLTYLWPWTIISSYLETSNSLLLSNFVKPEIRI